MSREQAGGVLRDWDRGYVVLKAEGEVAAFRRGVCSFRAWG